MSLDISRVRSERLRCTSGTGRAYSHEIKLIREPERNRSSGFFGGDNAISFYA